MSAIQSGDKRDEAGRFIIPPKSPGRPKGARNKLGEAFLADMLADWEVHGIATIQEVRETKPDQYLKVVASILPKELNIKVNELDELSDEQLQRQLAAVVAQLADAGFDALTRIAEAKVPEPAGDVSAVH